MSALAITREILAAPVSAPVYIVVAPQTVTMPFIVLSLVHEAQDHVLEGANPAFFSRVSVACHGNSPAEAEILAEEAKAALEVVINRQVMAGGSPPSPRAGATMWKEGTDVFDYDDAHTVFRRIMDWRLRWWRLA